MEIKIDLSGLGLKSDIFWPIAVWIRLAEWIAKVKWGDIDMTAVCIAGLMLLIYAAVVTVSLGIALWSPWPTIPFFILTWLLVWASIKCYKKAV